MSHPAPKPPACHPTRKHFARGWCKSCYYLRAHALVVACVDCGVSIAERGPQARRCFGCVAFKRNKAQTAARPGKRGYFRKWRLASKYALTPEADKALGTTCNVCGRAKLSGGDRHIDHDHVNNQVRGVLCRRCNTGIGMLGDSFEGVMRAAEYLCR